jgi:hypothetical protein
MKQSFIGYYAPTSEQYEILWKEALFVLDTNVLLSLYRLPTLARDELLGVLDLLKDRLWIPHHVGLEFQRGRLNVIANERRSTEEALSAAQNVVGQVKSKVEGLQIDKRGLGIASKPLLDELEKSNQKLIDAITEIHKSQLDVSSTDDVRQKLDELLDGKVGKPPTTQEELDCLVSGGEDRFGMKIPPGFADADKAKNPNDSYFIYDHIKYERKFGDLILWKQLLHHVKETKTLKVLFITADNKEDWWWREQGKTIGPHPELMREINREGGVELFWMYSSVQFVEHANKYSKANVSTQSVTEIKQVTLFDTSHINPYYANEIEDQASQLYWHSSLPGIVPSKKNDKKATFNWLSRTVQNLIYNPEGNPDFLAPTPNGMHGYLLSKALNVTSTGPEVRIPVRVRNAIYQIMEGGISGLTVIFLLDKFETEYLMRHDGMLPLREQVQFMLKEHPIAEVFVGELIEDEFQVYLYHRGYPRKFADPNDVSHDQ